MFDQLLLLSCGRCMYMGPAAGSVDYFTAQGFDCPKVFNPSDYFLDVLSPDNRSAESEEESAKRIESLGDKWAAYLATQPKVERQAIKEAEPYQPDYSFARIRMNLGLLFWRTWAAQSRQWPVLVIKLCLTSFFGLIIGGIYSHVGYNQKSIQNRIGLLFIVVSKFFVFSKLHLLS